MRDTRVELVSTGWKPVILATELITHKLAGEGGIEPTINGVKGRCANRYTTLQLFGWDATDRTWNLRSQRPTICQLIYIPIIFILQEPWQLDLVLLDVYHYDQHE